MWFIFFNLIYLKYGISTCKQYKDWKWSILPSVFTPSLWTLVSILCTAHLIWDQPHFKCQQLHVATGYHIGQVRYRPKLNNPVTVGKYLVHLFTVFTWAFQNKVLVQPHNFLALPNRFNEYNKRTSSFHSDKQFISNWLNSKFHREILIGKNECPSFLVSLIKKQSQIQRDFVILSIL